MWRERISYDMKMNTINFFMTHLFMLSEISTNGMNYTSLTIISLICISCGITVIVSKNPIISVLFLIMLFVSIAGYLFMLGLNFIGLSYLLVYVGAVSILFLFILMLINVRVSELVTENYNSVPLAGLVTVLVAVNVFSPDFENIFNISIKTYVANEGYSNNILTAISPCWDQKLAETSHITTIGNILYTSYPMWLVLTSIILLLAMVGSILITIKQ